MAVNKFSRRANLVLGGVTTLFTAAAALKFYYPQSVLVRMAHWVTEAALVGGIADWFAVTALFRKPLGFPWHTGLVPRSRGKIIAAIACAVERELFSKDLLKKRLSEVRLVDFATNWLEGAGRKKAIRSSVRKYTENILKRLEPRGVARYGQYLLRNYLRQTPLAPEFSRALKLGIEQGKTGELLQHFISEAEVAVRREETKQKILKYLESYKQSKRKAWWQKLMLDAAELTNTLNIEEASRVLHYELLQLLVDLKDESHPLRGWLNNSLKEIADKLEHDEHWAKTFAAWQCDVVTRLELTDTLAALGEYCLADLSSNNAVEWVVTQVERFWEALVGDADTKDWLDERLKAAVLQLIDLDHSLVAMVVTDALSRMSDSDLNLFIEDKIGEDLAWIRINGSLIGGMVGLILFLFLNYVYDPYVVKTLQSFFS
ncbi:MAG: hypothetical protein H6Q73_1559 [Firmicutes bacterium]|nr:hypothetical protein [Bacillota bacterium]